MNAILPRCVRRILPALFLGSALGLTGMLGGCANNNSLMDSNRALTERNNQLTADAKAAQNALASAQKENADLRKANGELKTLADRLLAENSTLRDRLFQFDKDLAGLKGIALDSETDAALADLARQFPDLIEFDSQRGMLRFKSDFTFGSGSDVVSETGKRSIDALARILNSAPAQTYDLRIIGHTDSQKISSGTAKSHPTNWHLSTHRAIAVGRELQTMGVDPTRIEAAGRGEYDPMVPNNANGNTQANRRVEIFIVRGYRRGVTAGTATPAATTKATDDQMK